MINQLWDAIQVASAGIITLGGAGAIFVGLYRWAKKPDINRDEKLKGHDEKLDNDNRRINELERKQEKMEEDLTMIMSALSAIINHAITGNNKDELKEKRDEMQNYLIKRR